VSAGSATNRPREYLWTLVKARKRIDAELLFHGESHGWAQRFTAATRAVGHGIAPGLVFGGELEFAITKRSEIVPQVRMHWVYRTDDVTNTMWKYALGSMIWRPALGVRVSY
jgi:hypothetical protein